MTALLIEKLYDTLELGSPPEGDKTGTYSLEFLPEMTLVCQDLKPGFSLQTTLGPVQKLKKEELFIHLMKANFLGQGTGKSCIGLDPQEKSLTLSLLLPYEVDYKTFKETVEDFANFATYWRSELATLLKASEEKFL